MLLKIEKRILHQLLKQPDEHSISASKFNKYSNNDIYQAMKSLKEKGYLDLFDTSYTYENFSYVLSAKGRYYKEYLFRMFLHDIVIPILVSIITTLITLWLTA